MRRFTQFVVAAACLLTGLSQPLRAAARDAPDSSWPPAVRIPALNVSPHAGEGAMCWDDWECWLADEAAAYVAYETFIAMRERDNALGAWEECYEAALRAHVDPDETCVEFRAVLDWAQSNFQYWLAWLFGTSANAMYWCMYFNAPCVPNYDEENFAAAGLLRSKGIRGIAVA